MTDDADRFIEVELARLSPETLRRLVEEFVTRDGTDYGSTEKTVEQKAADVVRQLHRGEVRIVFDSDTETVNLVPATPRR